MDVSKTNATWSKFRLLLWKQYKLRKHRWFMTTLEIVLPILLVGGFIKMGEIFIRADGIIEKNATIEDTLSPRDIFNTAQKFRHLVYAPNTTRANYIVTKVVSMLGSRIEIEAVDNETQLEILLTSNRTADLLTVNSIGIVFVNLSDSGKFEYKLRDADEWFTETLFPKDAPDVPYRENPYLTQGFAGVQLALDTIFLKTKNITYPPEVKFQKFPYPEYDEENAFRKLVPAVVCFVVILTSLLLSVPLISSIIVEKSSGMKELMKMVGLEEWLIWTGWFLHATFLSFISFTIVTLLLQHEFFGPNSAAIRCVDTTILWSCIMLYCIANTAFCFAFSAVFHNPTIAGTMFSLVQMGGGYGMFLLGHAPKSLYWIRLSCWLPVGAFVQAFYRIQYFEVHDVSLGWMNLNLMDRNTVGVSLGYALTMLIVDIILYLFLAYYISAINPGQFGARKSPFFIFEVFRFRKMEDIIKEERLKSKFRDNTSQELVNLEDPSDNKYLEKAPANLEASIKIKDLHKNFGLVYAVKGVNLTVYKGEITALLGHNGAGKTTTLAVLTGVIKPTAGTIIYKNNIDVLKRMDEFRRTLGVCPQEDRLFPYLTVMDHLLFFGMLKGASEKEAIEEAKQYMRLMEIDSKADCLCSTLSGGMKRKLCLSISLMGKSETLILDEPTSGLDVESRRKLWDLLLELRGNRTIILTTHHMEEADALGDRIAIMNHGTIVCHGTSLFLKKSYETGYHLTMTKRQDSPNEAITRIIESEGGIHDVKIDSSSPTEVVYTLPLWETKKFPEMFRILETKKNDLDIESMGMSCTTMEQVFLKVGGASIFDSGGTSTSLESSSVTDGAVLAKYAQRKKVGLSLIIQQFKALMWKKYLYTIRNFGSVSYRILMPTIVLVFILGGPLDFEVPDTPLAFSLSTYPETKILLRNNTNSSYYQLFVSYSKSFGNKIVQSKNASIIQELLNIGRKNLATYQKDILLAAEFNQSDTTLLNNPFALHSLPISINTFSNILLRSENDRTVITAINHPLRRVQACQADTSRWSLLILWFWALAYLSVDLSTYFQMTLNVERIDGFKHIQFMSNVLPIIYWLSQFMFDFAFFFLVILGRGIAFKIFADRFSFLLLNQHLAMLFFVIALFIAGNLLFAYVISLLSHSKDGSTSLMFIFQFLGMVVVGIIYGVQSIANTFSGFWFIIYEVVNYIVLLVPPLNYFLTFIKFFNIWFDSTGCWRCSSLPCQDIPYLVFASTENQNGILKEVLFAGFNLILYSGILAIVEMGYVNRFVNKVLAKIFGDTITSDSDALSGDNDVKLEKTRVEMAANELSESTCLRKFYSTVPRKAKLSDSDPSEYDPLNGDHTTQYTLIAQGLKKNFVKKFHPFAAVDDVNFTVRAGECFGLLGVNGAGKSTTFRILTADLLPTKGDASILGIKLSENKIEYMTKAGYCAQSNCFLGALSGREMLTLIASIRGIHSDHVQPLVDKWLSILGLEEYQNKRCEKYSGGNKRKLCTAMSLIGDPAVVFLDEPTSGVDPVARRRLYAVMDQSKASGQTVVLTSHSMEECEKLCDRLTILAKGRMQCIGSAQHLKRTYAQGFSALVKIPVIADEDTLAELKKRFQEKFKHECILKDEHKTQLYYRITNVNLPWSSLFKKMEELKSENSLIEDYLLCDTSLEEVFISFAKQSSSLNE